MKEISKLTELSTRRLYRTETEPYFLINEDRLKINEIIDRLNSQEQPEGLDRLFELTEQLHKQGCKDLERKLVKDLKGEPEKANEDWKRILRIRLFLDNGCSSIGAYLKHEQIGELEDFISGLLKEREDELQNALGEITVANYRIKELEEIEPLLKKILKYFEEYQSDYLTEREEIHLAQELQGEIERLLSTDSK